MSNYYILDKNGKPKPMGDITEWGRWFESNLDNRHIGYVSIFGIRISTVFLGIDHRFSVTRIRDGAPILWETMIFGGMHDQYQERYATKEEALRGHRKAVGLVVKGLLKELFLVIKSKLSGEKNE